MGPPADREYAVEPVGAAIITPIGAVARHRFASAAYFQLNHAGESAAGNHRLV